MEARQYYELILSYGECEGLDNTCFHIEAEKEKGSNINRRMKLRVLSVQCDAAMTSVITLVSLFPSLPMYD